MASSRDWSSEQVGRQLMRNSALFVGARMLTATLSLAVVPVVVSKLGVAGWGTWEAVLASATLLSIFQSAVSGTLLWRMSEAFGIGNQAEIRRLAGLGVTAVLLLLAVIGTASWVFRFDIVLLLHVPADLRVVATSAFPIVVAAIVLGGTCETLEAVIGACQRTGLVPLVLAAGYAANYTVVIVAAASGLGLWALVVGLVTGLAVRFAGAELVARRVFGSVALVPVLPRRADLQSVRYSGLMLVGNVSGVLKDQTDKLVLATLASATWTGYYGLASRLAALVLELVRFFYNPLLTAAAVVNARGTWAGVRRLYDAMMTAVPVAAGAVAVVVGGLYDRLLVLWIGQYIPQVGLLLLLLLAGNTFAVMLTGPGTAICRGVGKVWVETTYLSAYLVLNLGLTIGLVLLMGPIGTVIASGASWAAGAVIFTFVLHGALDLPTAATRRAATALVSAAAVAAAMRLISGAVPASMSRFGALLALLGLGTMSLVLYLGLLGLLGVLTRSTVSAVAGVFTDRPAKQQA